MKKDYFLYTVTLSLAAVVLFAVLAPFVSCDGGVGISGGEINPVATAPFSSAVGNNTLTITLSGGTYTATPALADFTITTPGTPGFTNLSGGVVTRTSDTVVTITGLTAVGTAGSGQIITVAGGAQATQATSVAVTAGGGGGVTPYDKASKLNQQFTVEAPNPPFSLSNNGIAYDPSTKMLYAGSDPAVILDDTLDADLIAELAVIFAPYPNGINLTDRVTFMAGTATHVTLGVSATKSKLTALLNKVDVTLNGIPFALGVGDNFTVPAGRTLTLADDAGRIGKITLAKDTSSPGRLVLVAGAKLVFEATGTGAAVAQATAAFTATGSNTAFVDSADSSTVITSTAASVKSIQATAGFGVTIKAGAAQDGTIDSTSTFEDAT
jgi:hypothetical protein